MFILKDTNGKTIETMKEENFNEDYREAVAYAYHKYGKQGIHYTLEIVEETA